MNRLSPKERAWRARNPELAARFDRLPAGAKANIRTAKFGVGTTKLVRSADAIRREAEAARSRRRRLKQKAITNAAKLAAQETRHRPATEMDPYEERIFWDEYDRLMGNEG